jgi:hypothetical protein
VIRLVGDVKVDDETCEKSSGAWHPDIELEFAGGLGRVARWGLKKSELKSAADAFGRRFTSSDIPRRPADARGNDTNHFCAHPDPGRDRLKLKRRGKSR